MAAIDGKTCTNTKCSTENCLFCAGSTCTKCAEGYSLNVTM